jgi:hypothetical protein
MTANFSRLGASRSSFAYWSNGNANIASQGRALTSVKHPPPLALIFRDVTGRRKGDILIFLSFTPLQNISAESFMIDLSVRFPATDQGVEWDRSKSSKRSSRSSCSSRSNRLGRARRMFTVAATSRFCDAIFDQKRVLSARAVRTCS